MSCHSRWDGSKLRPRVLLGTTSKMRSQWARFWILVAVQFSIASLTRFVSAYSTSGGRTAAQSSSIVLKRSLPGGGRPARIQTTSTLSSAAASIAARTVWLFARRRSGSASVRLLYAATADIWRLRFSISDTTSSACCAPNALVSICLLPGPATTSSPPNPYSPAKAATWSRGSPANGPVSIPTYIVAVSPVSDRICTPLEKGLPFGPLPSDQVRCVVSTGPLDRVDQASRIEARTAGDERVGCGAAHPVATVGKVAVAPVHDAVPEGAGRVREGLAGGVASLQVVHVEPEAGGKLGAALHRRVVQHLLDQLRVNRMAAGKGRHGALHRRLIEERRAGGRDGRGKVHGWSPEMRWVSSVQVFRPGAGWRALLNTGTPNTRIPDGELLTVSSCRCCAARALSPRRRGRRPLGPAGTPAPRRGHSPGLRPAACACEQNRQMPAGRAGCCPRVPASYAPSDPAGPAPCGRRACLC